MRFSYDGSDSIGVRRPGNADPGMGVVTIDSALNAPPNPGQREVFDSHEHSGRPGSGYFGLNTSPLLVNDPQGRMTIRRLLSGPDTLFNTQGLDR